MPRRYVEQPITVFHHIAKTAGTTLRLVFKQFYGSDEILYLNTAHDMARARAVLADPDALRRIKLVYGHSACWFAAVYDGPVRLVAFVRDPFSRLVSHYRHSRLLSHDPYHKEAMRLPLEEYVRVSGQDDFLARQLLLPGPSDGFPLSPFALRGRLYDQALGNLRERFAFVGIAERFDESIVLLSQHMVWPRLPVYAPLNVNEKGKLQEDVSAKRQEIEGTYLAIDKLLYEQCVRRFEGEWNSDRQSNESLLDELREVRGAVDELLGVRDQIQRHVAAEAHPFASMRANPRLQAVKAALTSYRAIFPPGAPRNL
jgi:hypothetical protein